MGRDLLNMGREEKKKRDKESEIYFILELNFLKDRSDVTQTDITRNLI